MSFSICASYVRIRQQAATNRGIGKIQVALNGEAKAQYMIAHALSTHAADMCDAEDACDELASNPGTIREDWEALAALWEVVQGPPNKQGVQNGQAGHA